MQTAPCRLRFCVGTSCLLPMWVLQWQEQELGPDVLLESMAVFPSLGRLRQES